MALTPAVAAAVRFRRAELAAPADVVAPRLLGAVITHRTDEGIVAVRVTEVEAYSGVGADPASHAHRGRTPRNAVMFGRPGTAYVYFVYGMHWCLNVVCGAESEAAAVLVRAGEVIGGVPLARSRRPPARRDTDLARGPANLTAALGVTGTENGLDLLATGSPLQMRAPPRDALVDSEVVSGKRVGIRVATDRSWRWWVRDAPTVSRHRGRRADTQG